MEFARSTLSARSVTLLVLFLACWSWMASALPVLPADLESCVPVSVRDDEMVDCCVQRRPVKEFRFPDASEPWKLRKNAANLDPETIEKYNRASAKVRALPESDSRSIIVSNKLHCGYCMNAYRQQNSSLEVRVHGNWLLFAFHRWQVYFQERQLGAMIGDPSFAMPFFNWDNQSTTHSPPPNVVPEYFYKKPGLNARRDPLHMPPQFVDLRWGPTYKELVPPKDDEELRLINNNVMHQTMVSGSTRPLLFLGGVYRGNEKIIVSPGTFETGPHAAVHRWVGDAANWQEDLGPAHTATLDPLYFGHHANVDRLYEAWLALGRAPPTDPDFLNSSFYFFDELGEMVRVTVAQSLEMARLRYSYEPCENAWLKDPSVSLSTPDSSKPGARYWLAKAVRSIGLPLEPLAELLVDIPDIGSVRQPRFSSRPFRSRVSRPHAALHAAGQLDQFEEVLVIDTIWVPSREVVFFEIFINLPDADSTTPVYATEWCGTFSSLDQAGPKQRKSMFSISIGDKLKRLGIADQSSVVVSLVPRGSYKHKREIQIKTIRIELQ